MYFLEDDVEDKSSVRRNIGRSAVGTVGEVRRNLETTFFLEEHSRDPEIPTLKGNEDDKKRRT